MTQVFKGLLYLHAWTLCLFYLFLLNVCIYLVFPGDSVPSCTFSLTTLEGRSCPFSLVQR